VQHLGVGQQSNEGASVVEKAADIEPLQNQSRTSLDVVLQEREQLRAEVQRLETELEHYRAHAQRTSRLFQSVTGYADWVRESARRDAELTLKKARARADKTLRKLTQERERSQRELVRLQELTAETRTRLSAFTAIALQVLDAQGVEAVQADRASQLSPSTLADDLKDALESQEASARQAAAEPEGSEVAAPGDAVRYA
jgi:cell division initiation protein